MYVLHKWLFATVKSLAKEVFATNMLWIWSVGETLVTNLCFYGFLLRIHIRYTFSYKKQTSLI